MVLGEILQISRTITYARKGVRSPAKRVFEVLWWWHTTKTPYFLS